MIMSRSHAITAALAAAAALTATGITYASAASAPEAQTAPTVVHQAPVQVPADGGTQSHNSKGDEGNNNYNNDDSDDNDYGGNDRGGNDRGGRGHRDNGWIQINERSYTAHSSGCVVVVSGLGSRSLNIRNDSRKTVEVFRGATCDNGAPIATVGPHSTSNGVNPRCTRGIFVRDGIVASFRVVKRHDGGDRDDY